MTHGKWNGLKKIVLKIDGGSLSSIFSGSRFWHMALYQYASAIFEFWSK
jgi:hypothetical protein